ncbi:hypothetical protein D3C87_1340330 [compost metagenome]
MTVKASYSSVKAEPLSVVFNDSDKTSHNMVFYKYQNYILSTTTANQDEELIVRDERRVNVKQGDIWAVCYYFNKK